MPRKAIADGRQIVIFPEGTRRPPGAEPDYKPGAAALYGALDVPCVPVALNSGICWPRRKFLRHPGTIVVEFLEPIPPGLKRKAFAARAGRPHRAGLRAVEGRGAPGSDGGKPRKDDGVLCRRMPLLPE